MKRLIFTIAALLAAVSASAQVGGRVIMAPYFDNGSRLQLSQVDRTMGTARSAAMGGAFTSLGADLSSMSINPAGLGMYQSSDFGVTAALSMDGVKTTPTFGQITSKGERTNFGLNNLGLAWNVLNQSKGLTSLTVGFGYNRAANFNSRSEVYTTGEGTSIVQMFREQMDVLGVDYDPDYLDTIGPFYDPDIYLSEWAAILGYQTFLVDYMDGEYVYPTSVNPNDSYFGSVTRGGIYEYDFSIGANLSNKLYLGATVTASDIDYREETSYEEWYYDVAGDPAMFTDMFFDQTTKIRGSGIGLKLGAIWRPVEALRIGVTYHSPTWYSLTKSYYGNLGNSENAPLDTGEPLMDDIRYRTAPRLSTGISGVIGGRAILAVDYEVAWYNKIDSDLFKPSQTLRAGLEIAATDFLSVRAGGTYGFDMMKEQGLVADHPAPIQSWSLTGGLGFRLGTNGYLDVAYVYNRAKLNDFNLYSFSDPYASVSQGRDYSSHRNRNMVSLTLGTRF